MDQLFSNGRMIDLAMAVLLVETVGVWALARGRSALLPTLLSGLMLMLAWRLAQSGVAWIWIALPLSAAGVAHVWDLWRRWPTLRRA